MFTLIWQSPGYARVAGVVLCAFDDVCVLLVYLCCSAGFFLVILVLLFFNICFCRFMLYLLVINCIFF